MPDTDADRQGRQGRDLHATGLHRPPQQTTRDGAVKVDVECALAAAQTAQVDQQGGPVRRRHFPAGGDVAPAGHVARTARQTLTLVDPVDVGHPLARQQCRVNTGTTDLAISSIAVITRSSGGCGMSVESRSARMQEIPSPS